MTNNFRYAELTSSAYAIKHNIENVPNAEQLDNLFNVAINLERIREHLNNYRIIVNSGFRSPVVNTGVGGSPTSDHLNGHAVDIQVINNKSTIYTARQIIKMGLNYDQIIIYSTFIHISFAPRMRKQVIYRVPKYSHQ